jgi:hypothetical protein
MVTPLDQPMHDFNAYSPPSTAPFTLFPRKQPTSAPVSVTLSAALKRGESQTQDLSYLSTPRMADFALQMPYSSSPTTSDAGLTTASTATSPAMSRSNINDHDMLSRTNMLRVNSTAVLRSTNGNTTMFTPYTISEDRTGSQESVTRQRLSALGDRSRKREMQEFCHNSVREKTGSDGGRALGKILSNPPGEEVSTKTNTNGNTGVKKIRGAAAARNHRDKYETGTKKS